jgi:hypothetical protein
MFAIRHRKTKQWVYGTDYRMCPHHQRTSDDQALTYKTSKEACQDYEHRDCSRALYEIVEVKLQEVEHAKD